MDSMKIMACLAKAMETDVDTLLQMPPASDLSKAGLESIKFIQFIVLLEEEMGITVRDSDLLLTNFNTREKLFATLSKYEGQNTALKKCLVVDCDNVLWLGVAAEDGVDQIRIETEQLRFQNLLVELYERGVLLCLCSKNEDGILQQVWEAHPDMPLKRRHIIREKVNWKDKADNIRDLACELNLALDSFVFVDDQAYELGLIQLYLPQVEIVQADYSHPEFIEYVASLFTNAREAGSLNRTELYRQQKERERMKARFYTRNEYNAYLQTEVDCRLARREDCERLSELSMRTNQFNLAQSRYTPEDLCRLLGDPKYHIFCLSAKDRFGDMGIVAMAVLREDTSSCLLEGMMLSCRAFGRGFETILLEKVKRAAGTKALQGRYVKNAKNARYEGYYSDNGISTMQS